ncbi:hypothetical protein [Caulobacter soli]|uniref:hypothetical protein n=1 Tax=Caulobacter soli TaxID=2708539 RepID=UPI0013EC9D0D|nr:hypothetical protein [Caulobacter soli]
MNFDTGRAFKLTTDILRREALKLLPLAVLLVGLPNAAAPYLIERFTRPGEGSAGYVWAVSAAILLVAMLSTALLQAAVAYRFWKSRRPVIDQGGSDSVGRIFDVAALGLVTSLGILAGFVLLIIPGIILSLAWFVAVPAMVSERLGVLESIRRSNKLTGEARGAIFGLAVAIGLAEFLFGWLAQLLAGVAHNAVADLIAGPALQTATGLINAALVVAVYDELRWSQEAPAENSIEAIFS